MNILSKRIILITISIVVLITLSHAVLLFDYYSNVWDRRVKDIKDSLTKILYDNKNSFITDTLLQQTASIEMMCERLKKYNNLEKVKWTCSDKPLPPDKAGFKILAAEIILEQPVEIPNGQYCTLYISKSYTPLLKSAFFRYQVLFIIVSSLFLILVITFSVHWMIKKYLQNPVSIIFSAINKLSDKEYKLENFDTKNPEFNTILEKLRVLGLIIKEDKKELEFRSKLASIGQISAMLAHDVRKPFSMLRSILSMMDVLKKDPKELGYAKKEIEKGVRNVEYTLNEIMDFPRELTLDTKPAYLKNIFDFTIRQIVQSYQYCDIAFEYDLRNTKLPLLDEERIARVFGNILSNAIDAITVLGKKKSGTITVAAHDTLLDGKTAVNIIIGNDGPALKKEDLPNIFDSFFTKGKRKGTELGLASAHKIVKLHGGEIHARNKADNGGVEFVITVPAHNVPPSFANPSELKQKNLPMNIKDAMLIRPHNNYRELESLIGALSKAGSRFNILLLEDETLYRASIKNTVKKNELLNRMITLYDAHTVEEAVKLLEAVNITHAIVDIDLGDTKNGFDFLSKVRTGKNRGPKCMVHTNRHLDEYREKAKKLGAVMFVPKPLNIEHLVAFLSEKKHILYSDDEPLMRKFLTMKIEELMGDTCIVETFENAESLLAHLKELGSCEIVFTDQNMGNGMSGIELIKEINTLGIRCKKIIVTNTAGEDFFNEAKQAGADKVLNPSLLEEQDIISALT